MEPYFLSVSNLCSVTKPDFTFGTTKFLPKPEQIPEEFYIGNIYTQLAEALYFNDPAPKANIEIRPQYLIEDILFKLKVLVLSHLRSTEPKHEDKIAGVAYLLSVVSRITYMEKHT